MALIPIVNGIHRNYPNLQIPEIYGFLQCDDWAEAFIGYYRWELIGPLARLRGQTPTPLHLLYPRARIQDIYIVPQHIVVVLDRGIDICSILGNGPALRQLFRGLRVETISDNHCDVRLGNLRTRTEITPEELERAKSLLTRRQANRAAERFIDSGRSAENYNDSTPTHAQIMAGFGKPLSGSPSAGPPAPPLTPPAPIVDLDAEVIKLFKKRWTAEDQGKGTGKTGFIKEPKGGNKVTNADLQDGIRKAGDRLDILFVLTAISPDAKIDTTQSIPQDKVLFAIVRDKFLVAWTPEETMIYIKEFSDVPPTSPSYDFSAAARRMH